MKTKMAFSETVDKQAEEQKKFEQEIERRQQEMKHQSEKVNKAVLQRVEDFCTQHRVSEWLATKTHRINNGCWHEEQHYDLGKYDTIKRTQTDRYILRYTRWSEENGSYNGNYDKDMFDEIMRPSPRLTNFETILGICFETSDTTGIATIVEKISQNKIPKMSDEEQLTNQVQNLAKIYPLFHFSYQIGISQQFDKTKICGLTPEESSSSKEKHLKIITMSTVQNERT